jgi:hypothetical protein
MMHTLLRFRLPAVLALAVLAWVGNSSALAAYTDNTDGTVTDTATGLMWDKCSWGQTNNVDCSGGAAGTYTWQQALALAVTANSANYKGHNDWRLPNVKELESVLKIDAANPAIDATAFPNTITQSYWSSTPYTPNPARAWYVNFYYGNTDAYDQSGNILFVRLVRSGQSFAAFDALPVAPTVVPTLSESGLIALSLLMAGAAALGLRRRG